eukprot:110421-Pyramimonas_sp.AAC.1
MRSLLRSSASHEIKPARRQRPQSDTASRDPGFAHEKAGTLNLPGHMTRAGLEPAIFGSRGGAQAR